MDIGENDVYALFISLCETKNGRRFFLIHRPIEEKEKVDSKQTMHLNAMLDKLLTTNFDIN